MPFKQLLQKQWNVSSDPLLQFQLHTQNVRTFQICLFLCAFVAGGDGGGLGAAEAVVLYLHRGNHSIFAEQACARKLSYIVFWH